MGLRRRVATGLFDTNALVAFRCWSDLLGLQFRFLVLAAL